MVSFYVCSECKKYYSEDNYVKLKYKKPKTRICEKCGAEMSHQKCYRRESYH